MILAVIGLLTLLLALVFGTLVGNASAFFAMQLVALSQRLFVLGATAGIFQL